ncbi:MAG: helix-turn-helix domain-containing protein [Bacteroidota bacterium]
MLGDHIRARRMNLSLYQTELAKRLGVHQMTVVNWELHGTLPLAHVWTELVEFLGYYPGSVATLGDRLLGMRLCRGLTQRELADELGIHYSTICWRERRGQQARKRCVSARCHVSQE